ncbi:MAG: hypothetical protein K2M82_00805 [Lachnospiraceae bacterium]|nr:hypothetical protein [Lachnospiraceae bacterium]
MGDNFSAKKAAVIFTTAAVAVSAVVGADAAEIDENYVAVGSPAAESELYDAVKKGSLIVSEDSGVQITKNTHQGTVLHSSGLLPSSYKSEVTSVKNQGEHGTCWAFGSTSALEAFLIKDGKGVHDLSENHLAWWGTSQYNTDGFGWQNNTIDSGGFAAIALGYYMSWQGPATENEVPYDGSNTNTLPSNMDTASIPYNVTGAMYLSGDVETIKNAVYRYGGVNSSYNDDQIYMSEYNGCKNFYYPPLEHGINNLDYPVNYYGHAVCIVGWDDNYPKEAFNNTPENDGAWLVKNSWGDWWSDGGYFWMSYEDYFLNMENVMGFGFAITDVRTNNPYDIIYQNEDDGVTNSIGIYNGYDGLYYPDVTYISKFNFDGQHNIMEKVIFETESADANYTVYYIPSVNGEPSSDTASWTVLNSGVIEYSGYQSIDIKNFTLPEGEAFIGVQIDMSRFSRDERNIAARIGVAETMYNSDNNVVMRPNVQEGEGYYYLNGKIGDLTTIYAYPESRVGKLSFKVIATTNRLGDIDNDGDILLKDAQRVQKMSIGIDSDTYTDNAMINADVNLDGKITLKDASLIQKRALDIISDF